VIAFYLNIGSVTHPFYMLTENSVGLIIGSLRTARKLMEAETACYDFSKA